MVNIFNWALGLGVATTGLIGLVLLLRRPMARFWGSQAVYLLWALPFLRLFMPEFKLPVKTTVNIPWSEEFYWFDNFGDGPSVMSEPVVPIATPPIVEKGIALPEWPVILVSIWMFIGMGWFALQLYRHIKYWHLLNNVSSLIGDDLAGLSQKAADIIGLRKLPRVKIAPKTIGPVVSGIFKPLIILPLDFETTYSKDEQLYALCHEMAHIRRYDLPAAFAFLIFRAVHWYNPIVHYAAHRFSLDQEAACDAFLFSFFEGNDKFGYAQTLLKVERIDAKHDTADRQEPQAPSLALARETL